MASWPMVYHMTDSDKEKANQNLANVQNFSMSFQWRCQNWQTLVELEITLFCGYEGSNCSHFGLIIVLLEDIVIQGKTFSMESPKQGFVHASDFVLTPGKWLLRFDEFFFKFFFFYFLFATTYLHISVWDLIFILKVWKNGSSLAILEIILVKML